MKESTSMGLNTDTEGKGMHWMEGSKIKGRASIFKPGDKAAVKRSGDVKRWEGTRGR